VGKSVASIRMNPVKTVFFLTLGLGWLLITFETKIGLKLAQMSWLKLMLVQGCILLAAAHVFPPASDKQRYQLAPPEPTNPSESRGKQKIAKQPKVKADKSAPGQELQLSQGNLSDAAREQYQERKIKQAKFRQQN
jgi:hypothetical protein